MDDHRTLWSGEYTQTSLVEPLSPINRWSRHGHDSGCSPHGVSLSPDTVYKFGNRDGPFVFERGLKDIGGSRTLVVCKVIFRSKKIGGSSLGKVNWWIRNFLSFTCVCVCVSEWVCVFVCVCHGVSCIRPGWENLLYKNHFFSFSFSFRDSRIVCRGMQIMHRMRVCLGVWCLIFFSVKFWMEDRVPNSHDIRR